MSGVSDDRRRDAHTPVERVIRRSLDDEGGEGKPLSRRARQTPRKIEHYLVAGFMPRYMQRLRDIDAETAAHRRQLARSYRALRGESGDEIGQFERRWRALASNWDFERVNELIREHNEWYPLERQLPLNPRTRDYVPIRGRSYRRRELGPDWILEQFPA